MEITDNIAVMNGGKIEQHGPPRELYDAPNNAFVMGFLGPVATLDGVLVRPHDLLLTSDPREGAVEAQVSRIVHLGFEVRIEAELADGEKVWVQVTRGDAELLEAEPGDIVWIGTDAAAGGTTVPAPAREPAAAEQPAEPAV